MFSGSSPLKASGHVPSSLVATTIPEPEIAFSTAALISPFKAGGADPPMHMESSLQPWNASAYSKRRPITVFNFGNDSSLISVEVMCHLSKAPPPCLKPLQTHAETHLDASCLTTRSACSSVCRSISPPCG